MIALALAATLAVAEAPLPPERPAIPDQVAPGAAEIRPRAPEPFPGSAPQKELAAPGAEAPEPAVRTSDAPEPAAREPLAPRTLAQVPARPETSGPAGPSGPSDRPAGPQAVAKAPLPPVRLALRDRAGAAPGSATLTAAPPASTDPPCGDPRLEGARLSEISDPDRPCGIGLPVRISRVAGVSLAPPATLDCATARTLADWTETVAQPAAREVLDSRLERLRVAASYVCRTRNNRPGARLSLHGLGRAVDLRAFALADGREVSVLDGWGRGAEGRFLSRLRSGACGPFATVLGPGSDAYHDDHFHFDTAERARGARYCP